MNPVMWKLKVFSQQVSNVDSDVDELPGSSELGRYVAQCLCACHKYLQMQHTSVEFNSGTVLDT